MILCLHPPSGMRFTHHTCIIMERCGHISFSFTRMLSALKSVVSFAITIGILTNAKSAQSGVFTAFVLQLSYQIEVFKLKDFTQLTPDELNKMDKKVLITIIGSLQIQLNTISSQLDFLTEQIALMNQRSFGRKTEQLSQMNQMTLYDIFNEPEAFCDDSKEPEIQEIVVSTHTRKKKSKREDNLEGLPARIFKKWKCSYG